MSADPLKIIGEVLGEPAAFMRNPVNADYQCPFINSQCIKRGHSVAGPNPVCSIWRRGSNKKLPRLICTCPKRFYEVDFISDVIQHCWIGDPPENPRVSYEVKMAGFGQVDFVIADIDPKTHSVKDFVSVELQAVDITGSVEPAYSALINSSPLNVAPRYGLNWANVRKRYVSQLIAKGFFHHHWNSRIVAVLQVPVYEEFRKFIQFDELDPKKSNIVFMLYDYFPSKDKGDGYHSLALKEVVGTSHSSLMNAALYRTPPKREEFCARILKNIRASER